MPKSEGTTATREKPSRADQGTTPVRQKVLTYLLKRKATAAVSGVPAKEVYENAGGMAVCKAMAEAGQIGEAKLEEGKAYYLTATGKKLAGKAS